MWRLVSARDFTCQPGKLSWILLKPPDLMPTVQELELRATYGSQVQRSTVCRCGDKLLVTFAPSFQGFIKLQLFYQEQMVFKLRFGFEQTTPLPTVCPAPTGPVRQLAVLDSHYRSWGLSTVKPAQATSDGCAFQGSNGTAGREDAGMESSLFKQHQPTETFLPAHFFQPQIDCGLCRQVTHPFGKLSFPAVLGSPSISSKTYDGAAGGLAAGSNNAPAAFSSYPYQCVHQQASGASHRPLHSDGRMHLQPFVWPTTLAGWAYAAAGCGIGILETPSALLRQAFEGTIQDLPASVHCKAHSPTPAVSRRQHETINRVHGTFRFGNPHSTKQSASYLQCEESCTGFKDRLSRSAAGWAYAAAGYLVGILEAPCTLLRAAFKGGLFLFMVERPPRKLEHRDFANKCCGAVLQTLVAAFASTEPPHPTAQQDLVRFQDARLSAFEAATPSTDPPAPETLESCVLTEEDVAEQAAILDGCAAQDQGPRKTMEDTYILRNSLALSEFSWTGRPPARSGLYAVFDGHCGAGASHFARDNLLQFLKESDNFPHAAQTSLTQALLRMESSLAEEYRSHQQKSQEASPQPAAPGLVDELGGTTALVAMLLGDVLHVANIGDCRAVLCRRNEDGQPEAIALSTDHTPELEMARIKATGYDVSDNRIDGIIELLEEDEFLILASDGFWKMHASNEAAIKEARRRLRKQLSPRHVADELVQDVLSRNGDDNVTVIVVQLARLPDLPRTTSSRLRLSPSFP
ncbi:hypothetical protein WJX74_003093 [Apatococcus lobatus]|uniref:PPM-type phosphatase domain-containing protein n=1 Tax=Apatococcus lobatus TaxID=904363 RepID=A0AAW1RJ65_9CHLO